MHLHLEGRCGVCRAGMRDAVPLELALHRPALRKPIEEGRADFTPVFLSDIPLLFTSGPHPARRRAPPALAARQTRLLHARHLGRRRASRQRAARASSSPRSTSRCRARTATRSCRSSALTAFTAHRTARCRRTTPPSRPPVEDADRRAHRAARPRRRDAADGHRRDPRRRPRGASSTSTTSASTPRCSATASSISSRPGVITNRRKNVHPRPDHHELRRRLEAALRLRRRQPVRRVLSRPITRTTPP